MKAPTEAAGDRWNPQGSDAMKWLLVFALLGNGVQTAVQSDIAASVFSATSKTLILRWTRYSGASSYKVTVTPRNTPNNPAAFAQFGANIVMGSVKSLSPNTLYDIDIEALDSSQATLSSDALQWRTAPEAMDPIETAKPKDSTTLIVEFGETTGATEYIVRVQNTAGYFRESTVLSSPARVQSLEQYTDYSLSIIAVNNGGRSQPSPSTAAKTALPPPQLTASSPTNDSIVVSWELVDHAVHYSLVIHRLGSDNGATLNTTDTSMTVSGLEAGSLYVIRGYAWDPEGRRGEGSSYINQTTRPPTPASLTASVAPGDGSAELLVSWDLGQEVHGTTEYFVTSDANLQCNSTSGGCSLSPVACGETHTIQVTAWNEAGPSLPSNPLVFVTFPCPPESLAAVETDAGNCTLAWNAVPHADKYAGFIKRGDGGEVVCNTTGDSCNYTCQCGHTYLMSVYALNQAGSSPPGRVLNYTTLPCCPEDVSISLVTPDTMEIAWTAARGAELYETRAADRSEVILCNDTAPVCALSDLRCNSLYTVLVTPCNDVRGCNRHCHPHTKETAPCMPTDLTVNRKNTTTCITVSWTADNRAANYTVTARGGGGVYTCTTADSSCDLSGLSCGSIYEVSSIARSPAGLSLPSYSVSWETAPCCPVNLTVDQVTQAMSNVTWSHARGAESFITSLTSSRGHARCHAQDSHCLMGCITCGTNYTVSMEAFSRSGVRSNCTYQGFSSSACCPWGIKLHRMANDSLRVYWRAPAGHHNYTAEMVGSSANYTCTPPPGENRCDVSNVQCGGVYHVVVAPLTRHGGKVEFCHERLYSVTCSGSGVGMVIYRGKRSVD
ncbi:fibronectin type III domain-containing protein 7-like [Lampris incognitus]|uniref:fibronectin type III domain-containing protein 7-like n=1 Tax=Lampris incognitus TaxID=2546036 RepID=UPI0024B558C6|nr:fibronectin type III domain-containing protein 7-like [Lampris incognitus]